MTTITQPAATTPGNPLARLARRRPLTSYFVLAYAISWSLVLPMTFSTNIGLGLLPYALPDALGLILYILASLVGPTVAAMIVAGLAEGRAGVAALLRPIARWRVGPQWYVFALFANMTIWLLAYSLVLGPALLGAALAHWPLLFSIFLPALALDLLIRSIGEEPGWRCINCRATLPTTTRLSISGATSSATRPTTATSPPSRPSSKRSTPPSPRSRTTRLPFGNSWALIWRRRPIALVKPPSPNIF